MNIAFIPARCGSKSIPFKNIKIFCGKPLIYWSLKPLNESELIDQIIVATDCDKVKDVVESFDFEKVRIYTRSKENAQDHSTTESVILEYLDYAPCKEEDNLVLVQVTSPLTERKDFEEALNKYNNEKPDSLLSCVRTKRFVWDDSGKPINYDYKNRPRRQDFKGLLVENGAFYISSIGNIVKNKNRISGQISVYEMDEYKYTEIDEEDDWILAEALKRKYQLSKIHNSKIKILLSDVDGTLTDAGMYYSENGDELKKFNTRDGKGFEMLKKRGVKVGIITSENTRLVEKRARKLKVDFLYQGLQHSEKLIAVKDICVQEKVSLKEVAYIGDDINDLELLSQVGHPACPNNAVVSIKKIPNINIMNTDGGNGAVREFIDTIIDNNLC